MGVSIGSVETRETAPTSKGIKIRLADSGERLTLYRKVEKGDWEMNPNTGFREKAGQETAINPTLKKKLPPQSVLNFGKKEGVFITSKPTYNKKLKEQHPNSIFVQRIRKENIPQIAEKQRRKGRKLAVFNLKNIPLSSKSRKQLEETT